jgi:hypothetical protein
MKTAINISTVVLALLIIKPFSSLALNSITNSKDVEQVKL